MIKIMISQYPFYSDLIALYKEILSRKSDIIYYVIGNLSLLSLLYFEPALLPAIVVCLLTLPLAFLLKHGARFDESLYTSTSFILKGLTNYRFIILSFVAIIPLVGSTITSLTVLSWNNFDIFTRVVITLTILVFILDRTFYQKNFYFDKYHYIDRVIVLLSGVLSIIYPIFTPLFLLFYNTVAGQLAHPNFKFSLTHSKLPYTMILIFTLFIYVDILFKFEQYVVSFLLLCGFSSHYFHSGMKKLKENFTGFRFDGYHIKYDNPVFVLLNSHKYGWLPFLDETRLTKILNISYNYNLNILMNLSAYVAQIGSIFILFSPGYAIFIAISLFSFHIAVTVLSGDNFWQWEAVDIGVVFGILLAGQSIGPLFDNIQWMFYSIVFIILSGAWMNPKKLGWLNTPYTVYYEIKGILKDGSKITIPPNCFAPYGMRFSQSIAGSFDQYVGSLNNNQPTHPILRVGNLSFTDNKDAHRSLLEIVSGERPIEDSRKIINEGNEIYYHERKTDNIAKQLTAFRNNKKLQKNNVLDYILPPYEFHWGGIRIPDFEPSELDEIQLVRTHGIWTYESFHTFGKRTTLSVEINSSDDKIQKHTE